MSEHTKNTNEYSSSPNRQKSKPRLTSVALLAASVLLGGACASKNPDGSGAPSLWSQITKEASGALGIETSYSRETSQHIEARMKKAAQSVDRILNLPGIANAPGFVNPKRVSGIVVDGKTQYYEIRRADIGVFANKIRIDSLQVTENTNLTDESKSIHIERSFEDPEDALNIKHQSITVHSSKENMLDQVNYSADQGSIVFGTIGDLIDKDKTALQSSSLVSFNKQSDKYSIAFSQDIATGLDGLLLDKEAMIISDAFGADVQNFSKMANAIANHPGALAVDPYQLPVPTG
jgi:hypothetical protein